MERVIAVVNQKGGVGKTTTSVNLSACIAETGKKVLLIDLDPQGNATSGLGARAGGQTIYEALLGQESPEKCIFPTVQKNLWLMAADIRLTGAELELVDLEKREYRLKTMLGTIEEGYDYVFIDCPPSLGLLTLNALTAANRVLIPIQCEYYALEGVTSLMNTVNRVKHALNPGLNIAGILLTMYDGRTNLSIQVVDSVKKHFKNHVFKTAIPRNVRLGEAPSHGLPIHQYDNRSIGADSYRRLAQELMERC